MLKLGLIVNPIAGIGGKVGLKGSDGAETLCRARELGACPESCEKTSRAIKEFADLRDGFELYTCAGGMGQNVAEQFGIAARIVGGSAGEETTAEDSIAMAKAMAAAGVDMLLFAGGDGTARNIMDAVGESLPVLGIPAGCKIHSAVFAINPKTAGIEVRRILEAGRLPELREAEVMDIDEGLFRQGIVRARLYGYMSVPDDKKRMQNLKSGRAPNEKASVDLLSNCIVDNMEKDTLYIIGSGSTMMAVKDKLKIDGTLLGVDIVFNGGMMCSDATEKQILAALDEYNNAKVIVTAIGGQGYIFGRGNQQLSAQVLMRVGKENIIVAMSKDKAESLFMRNLYIDTADEQVDAMLCGYYRVLVGYGEYVMFRAACE